MTLRNIGKDAVQGWTKRFPSNKGWYFIRTRTNTFIVWVERGTREYGFRYGENHEQWKGDSNMTEDEKKYWKFSGPFYPPDDI